MNQAQHDSWLEFELGSLAEIRGIKIRTEEKPLIIDSCGYGHGYTRHYYWDAVEPDTLYCVELGVNVHPHYGEVDYDNLSLIICEMH
jgi:hypothetical protein